MNFKNKLSWKIIIPIMEGYGVLRPCEIAAVQFTGSGIHITTAPKSFPSVLQTNSG